MVLVRQVFQVKWGMMDKVLEGIQAAADAGIEAGGLVRISTDISGSNFTLVFETRAESVDASMAAMQASFQDEKTMALMAPIMDLMESGHREFYNIEWEA
jgi:hypothetical protein